MKRLIPLLLLAACGEPVPPPAAEPEPAPAAQAPVIPQPEPAPEPAATPAPNSPEEALEIARTYLEAKYPGREVKLGDPGGMEGAAGSIYIEIPATVGGSPPLSGTVVLRRANEVPGSTAEQRRWHVESDSLK